MGNVQIQKNNVGQNGFWMFQIIQQFPAIVQGVDNGVDFQFFKSIGKKQSVVFVVFCQGDTYGVLLHFFLVCVFGGNFSSFFYYSLKGRGRYACSVLELRT